MKALQTSLPGVLLVEPHVNADERGWLVEIFERDRYREAGIGIGLEFVQDNQSSSVKHALRGLHYRLHEPQGKLVWATRGVVFDVVVDVRTDSPTFKAWFATELSATNHRQLWVPPGFAHGFLALSDDACVAYKLTAAFAAHDERTIAWNDPDLAIAWPITTAPLLSPRDRDAPALRDAELPRS